MPSIPHPVCSRSIITKSAPAAAAIRGTPSVWNSNSIVPSATSPPASRERIDPGAMRISRG